MLTFDVSKKGFVTMAEASFQHLQTSIKSCNTSAKIGAKNQHIPIILFGVMYTSISVFYAEKVL
jgi:hypothetical protein